MNLPAEIIKPVCYLKSFGMGNTMKRADQIEKYWPGSCTDIVYENAGHCIISITFETPEDCLAFTLKYGK